MVNTYKQFESGAAIFSRDRVYRYTLTRMWDAEKPWGIFIGLNPSTADEDRLDNTLRRVIRYLDREGCGAMIVVNLFAFRATDPRAMLMAKDPVGEDNDHWINQVINYVTSEGPILCGWGTNGNYLGRSREVLGTLPMDRACYLTMTKDGEPGHPLYLPSAAPFVPWPERRR